METLVVEPDMLVQVEVLSQLEQLYHEFKAQGEESRKEPLVKITHDPDCLEGTLELSHHCIGIW